MGNYYLFKKNLAGTLDFIVLRDSYINFKNILGQIFTKKTDEMSVFMTLTKIKKTIRCRRAHSQDSNSHPTFSTRQSFYPCYRPYDIS